MADWYLPPDWPKAVATDAFRRIETISDTVFEMLEEEGHEAMDLMWPTSDEHFAACLHLYLLDMLGHYNQRLGCHLHLHEFLARQSAKDLARGMYGIWITNDLRQALQDRVRQMLRPWIAGPVYSWDAETAGYLSREFPHWESATDEEFDVMWQIAYESVHLQQREIEDDGPVFTHPSAA